MPWIISKRGDQYCVVKQGQSDPVPGGCHTDRADAIKHQRALYANEPKVASMEIPATLTINAATNSANPVVTYVSNEVATLSEIQALMAATAPLKPPLGWFEMPEPNEPTPMTYEDSGQVYGHLALWSSCHTSFDRCIAPPRSKTDYGQFHLGQMQTEDGTLLPVGRITFNTNHAPLQADGRTASSHYDHTGAVGAYVRAKNGKQGIWLSGTLRSDLPAKDLVTLRGNPLSGDWRPFNHNLEMIAALAVPVAGYQIPVALAASGEVAALILTAPTAQDLEEEEALVASYTRAQILKKKMLKSRVGSLTAAVLTTEKRKALPKSDFAIPSSRSYPIHDVAHARNALARSAGKPEEAQVRRAVCRRYPDMGECAA